MNQLVVLLRHEVRLQLRYRVYAAMVVVAVVYVAIIGIFASSLPSWFLVLVIYTDPAVLGFFFLGGLMLLERNERVRDALGVAPVSAGGYLAAKVITLTALVLVVVVFMGLASGRAVSWSLLTAATVLTSVHYIGLGALLALRFASVTGYLFGSTIILLPLVLPGALAFFDTVPAVLQAIPAVAHIRLLMTALGGVSVAPLTTVLLLFLSIIWALVAFRMGERALQSEFGIK